MASAMAGSFSPLGWSFLSIAKMAMSWNEGDAWTKDAEFPLGAMLEYKYVVLEDQDWTKLQDEGAEGVVTTFRSNSEDSDSDGSEADLQRALDEMTDRCSLPTAPPAATRPRLTPRHTHSGGRSMSPVTR